MPPLSLTDNGGRNRQDAEGTKDRVGWVEVCECGGMGKTYATRFNAFLIATLLSDTLSRQTSRGASEDDDEDEAKEEHLAGAPEASHQPRVAGEVGAALSGGRWGFLCFPVIGDERGDLPLQPSHKPNLNPCRPSTHYPCASTRASRCPAPSSREQFARL